MISTEFDTPPIFEQPLDALADDFTDAYPDDTVDQGAEPSAPAGVNPGDKALALLASKERYKESPAQRTASLAYASLEQAAATDRMTAALDRQNAILERQEAILERQAVLAARQLAEDRKQNQLMFYSMSEEDFAPRRSAPSPVNADGTASPDSVYTQFKRSLGIIAAAPAASAGPAGGAEEAGDEDFS